MYQGRESEVGFSDNIREDIEVIGARQEGALDQARWKSLVKSAATLQHTYTMSDQDVMRGWLPDSPVSFGATVEFKPDLIKFLLEVAEIMRCLAFLNQEVMSLFHHISVTDGIYKPEQTQWDKESMKYKQVL